MYLGIDLGTSNSAVVGCEGAELRLFKAEDGRDVLPSVIHFSRSGALSVGARAYAQAEIAPDNVAHGFKRLMGTSSKIDLRGAGKTLTPEEASAEIIRALLRQASAEVGASVVKGVVITIPAAFNQMQSEATIRAAEMAGLDRVGLLQEPIAAAMAALEGGGRKDGRFLVYDLGGGTFDVALVEASSGAVNVIAHEGINMMGGRDFDRAIVDSVIRPWLNENFEIPSDATVQSKYKRLFALARYRAEQAKIELSTRDEAPIFLSDEETRAEDEAGNPIYVECTLTRAKLDSLIIERVDESIELCRKILRDNGLTHDDIDRVVLIGGPSKMPLIRERAAQQLGIAVDLKTDPMTAVARGAAIFAESRDWSEARGQRKSTRETTSAKGDIEVRLQYTARVSDDRARLRLQAQLPCNGYRYRILGPKGFDSGFQSFSGKADATLPLDALGESNFSVEVIGSDGRPACPQQFVVITRTQASATAIPATQTVAVEAATGPISERRNVLIPLVKKGTPLPANGTEPFKLREALTGDDDSFFEARLFNPAEGVDDPILALPIGAFTIRGVDFLDKGEKIPAGSIVNVHWRMDDNGLIKCSIELPDAGIHIEDKSCYVSTQGHRNFDGDEGRALAEEQIATATAALTATADALADRNSPEIPALQRRLARLEEGLGNSTEGDARRQASEEALHIQQDLARIRNRPENRKAVLLAELNDFQDYIDDRLRSFAPELAARFDGLGNNMREAMSREDWNKAGQIFEQMRSLLYRALQEQPEFVIAQFAMIAQERFAALDKALHDKLVLQGEEAANCNDIDGVRNVIRLLLNNRVQTSTPSAKVAVLAGLVR
ncbi:Hsp70 family protein [Sphingobium sp. MK2]|uniref:Hsp70 family protein n=1 Tax=Sphingobium sp. MK2 TaxID=3116540 RepID=UPI0032E3632F